MNAKTPTTLIAGLAALSLLAGCSGALMTQSSELRVAPPEQALVTILPGATHEDATRVEIWDGERLIGVLEPGSYFQFTARPGEHLIMGKGEEWSYVKATLAAGRRYTILAQLTPGIFKSNVALEPVRKWELKDPATVRRIELAMRTLEPRAPIEKRLDEFSVPKQPAARQAVAAFEAGKARYKVLEHDDSW